MIFLNTGSKPAFTVAHDQPDAAASIKDAVWIDLIDPSAEEQAVVQQATGLTLPARSDLSEIESSSRLLRRDDTLTLSMPLSSRFDQNSAIVTPLGFVLTKDRLVTIRYANPKSFDNFAEHFAKQGGQLRGPDAFEGLAEAIVDRLADVLEQIGAQLDLSSRTIFRPEMASGTGNRRKDKQLREILHSVGQNGDVMSAIRDTLLGLGRILGYITELDLDWVAGDCGRRLKIIRADIQSLNDYDQQLSNKIQFLLDATLGFINIQQNNIIKVLTVVSIVGIPPTLIAGIYGMNFGNIPEYKWAYGYQYSLVLMTMSGVLPVLWLWIRGWL